LPVDWLPSGADEQFAEQHGLSRKAISTEAVKFLNYWTAKSGAGAAKLDWSRTWQNWVLNAAPGGGGRGPPRAPVQSIFEITAELQGRRDDQRSDDQDDFGLAGAAYSGP
jgi:hypothetical protein